MTYKEHLDALEELVKLVEQKHVSINAVKLVKILVDDFTGENECNCKECKEPLNNCESVRNTGLCYGCWMQNQPEDSNE